MLSENKRVKYSPIDPYLGQSPAKDFANVIYEETENEDVQINDYSQFDYEQLRDKRQVQLPSRSTRTDMYRSFDPAERQGAPDPPSPASTTEPPSESDPPPEGNTDAAKEVKKLYLGPLYVITGIFAFMLIICPFFVRKGPNRGITQSSIRLTAFCMWIFWFTIYFGQMHPLMGPRLENTTVAWIAYKLGNPVGNQTY